MKKRKLVLGIVTVTASLAIISGCGKKADVSTTAATTAAETTKVETQAVEAEKYSLTEDYYEYMNHEFLQDIEIPADSNSWSYFYDLDNTAYEMLNKILQETVADRSKHEPGSTQQKIADLYLTSIDMKERDKTGFGELTTYFDRINSASTIQEYADTLLALETEAVTHSCLEFLPDVDLKDSTKYSLYLGEPNVGLGKEMMEDPSQEDLMKTYRQYISKLLQAYGKDAEAAEKSAEAIFNFQKDLVSSALPLNDANNPSFIYNVFSTEELAALFSNLDVVQMLAAGGIDTEGSFIVLQPEMEKKLNSYLTEDNLPFLKDYSIYCMISENSGYLTSEIRDADWVFEKACTGIAESKSDEKQASEMVQELLPFEFGKLYVEKNFAEEDKLKVKSMAEQVIAQYYIKLDDLEWLGADAKAAAKKKLDHMGIKVGYPDVWPNYLADTDILPKEEGGSLIHNVLEINRTHTAYIWEQSKKPVDRSQWYMTPQTVNAYYNPQGNEIVFPAAILQAPLYSPDATDAENLGGIGTVIAHEITHAFDTAGSQYDENGNFNIWWSEEDYQKFSERTKSVIDYYDGCEGFEGRHVNGAQTVGENIADLGGVSCITSIVGDDPEKLREVYSRYAQMWAAKYTKESMLMRLNTDPHSPSKVRVNAVLSATDGFYLAYPEITPESDMYIAPEKRVKVW